MPALIQSTQQTLRAGFEIHKTYLYPRRPSLPVPITALGGADDPGAGPRELAA